MLYLALVSLIWAFSFGLIKTQLAGLDPNLVAFLRMVLSLSVFVPLMRPHRLPMAHVLRLAAVGGIQFGLMYALYIRAFGTLKAHEVVLFTIFTPLYVTLVADLLNRRLNWGYLACALLAVIGTAVVIWRDVFRAGLLYGFLLVQVSNVCFAVGQVAYRRVMGRMGKAADHEVFGWLYLGAVLVTAAATALTLRAWPSFTATQKWTLLYLGVVASGLCFFFWNLGARKTNVGVLAVFNNVKIPLGIACSLVVFREAKSANIPNLLIGGAIIALALVLAHRLTPSPSGRGPG